MKSKIIKIKKIPFYFNATEIISINNKYSIKSFYFNTITKMLNVYDVDNTEKIRIVYIDKKSIRKEKLKKLNNLNAISK